MAAEHLIKVSARFWGQIRLNKGELHFLHLVPLSRPPELLHVVVDQGTRADGPPRVLFGGQFLLQPLEQPLRVGFVVALAELDENEKRQLAGNQGG